MGCEGLRSHPAARCSLFASVKGRREYHHQQGKEWAGWKGSRCTEAPEQQGRGAAEKGEETPSGGRVAALGTGNAAHLPS